MECQRKSKEGSFPPADCALLMRQPKTRRSFLLLVTLLFGPICLRGLLPIEEIRKKGWRGQRQRRYHNKNEAEQNNTDHEKPPIEWMLDPLVSHHKRNKARNSDNGHAAPAIKLCRRHGLGTSKRNELVLFVCFRKNSCKRCGCIFYSLVCKRR